MKSKKEYICPAVKVVFVEASQLLDGSGGLNEWTPAKGHNSFWDSWSEEDDEEKPMFQQPKSLWD